MNQTTGIEWLDTITTQELMDQLNSMPYIRPTKSIPRSEDRDGINLPLFNLAFDEICIKLGKLPTQDEYASYYVSKLSDKFIAKWDLDIEWMKERARRNYFSFVTEFSIYIVLREGGIQGLYDRQWDLKGVDFIVNDEETGKPLGLLCMANTQKSINHSHVKDKMRRKGITFPTWSVLPYDNCTQMINGTRIFTTLNGLHNASAKN